MAIDGTDSGLRFIDCGASATMLQGLQDMGVRPEELICCEVFYDPQQLTSSEARDAVRAIDPDEDLPVSTIPASVGLLGTGATRVQAIALRAGESAVRDGRGVWASGGPVVATRLVQAPEAGDIVEQSHAILAEIAGILEAQGANLDDVVKFNIYYEGEGTVEDWAKAARVRAGYFTEPGPATTGIPVPRFEDERISIAMQVVAIRGVREQRSHSWPAEHWDWPFHLPYKHGNRVGDVALIGGQVPLDTQAGVLDVDDFAAQVRHALAYVARVLAELDVPPSAVQRLTAYVALSPENAADRLSALEDVAREFFAPLPAIVPVPLPVLAYPQMNVEIEAQARVD